MNSEYDDDLTTSVDMFHTEGKTIFSYGWFSLRLFCGLISQIYCSESQKNNATTQSLYGIRGGLDGGVHDVVIPGLFVVN